MTHTADARASRRMQSQAQSRNATMPSSAVQTTATKANSPVCDESRADARGVRMAFTRGSPAAGMAPARSCRLDKQRV